jgi:dethiobiotin synthetase
VTGLRPHRLVYVVGTGTEVGKTWVAARLLTDLRAAGRTVAARKPAQSFDRGDDPAGLDAAMLGRASGEPADQVCAPHRCYPVALAPPMAALRLGRPPFTVDDLAHELGWSDADAVDVGLVESAGGVRSPQADDGDAVDLGVLLEPDVVVLVADAGLGTLNAVRLSVAALAPLAARGAAVVVVLNRFDPADALHTDNLAWLVERDHLRVHRSPQDAASLAAWCGTLPG